jgi:hypothetical protein
MTRVRGRVTRALTAGALALAAPMAPALVTAGPASAATTIPYSDPNASGYIGLCDQSGHQIASGRVDAAPFVWRAVSSVPAPDSYNGAGRTAALLGYLAMPALPPGDWSGELLTSSTRYSNPQAPTAEATRRDESLSALVADFPAQWEGFYELRIYLGAPDRETYQVKYPALNIQVKGNEWRAVGGGPVNCRASTAESVESILLPEAGTAPTPNQGQAVASPATAGPHSAGLAPQRVTGAGHPDGTGTDRTDGPGSTAGISGRNGAPAGPAAASQEQAGAAAQDAGAASSPPGGSGSRTVLIASLALAGILLGGGGYVVFRRRGSSPSPSSSSEPGVTP